MKSMFGGVKENFRNSELLNILGVPARNLLGCYKKIYSNCKEDHKQLEQRLFKEYTYNLEWLERFWMKEAFIVIAGPLETDPVDSSVKIVLISRSKTPTEEDLAILNECGIDYYTDINFEIKRIVSCQIVKEHWQQKQTEYI